MKPYLRPAITRTTALMGPAMLVEGLIQTLTLGKVQLGLPVQLARRILREDLERRKRANA